MRDLAAVQAAVRAQPKNALAIIMEAGEKESGYSWHTAKSPTQYVPVEVERVVTKTEYVDRVVQQPVADQATLRELARCKEQLAAVAKNAPTKISTPGRGGATPAQALFSPQSPPVQEHATPAGTARLEEELAAVRATVAKRDEQIDGLQAALMKAFRDGRGADAPEGEQSAHAAMLQVKVVQLQEELRAKEHFVQEVTQALVDMTNVVSGMQTETKHLLRSELAECEETMVINRDLERRILKLEAENARIPVLEAALKAHATAEQELQQQLDDKDDVITALEEQFRAEVDAVASRDPFPLPAPADLSNPSNVAVRSIRAPSGLSATMTSVGGDRPAGKKVGFEAIVSANTKRESLLARLTLLRFRIGLKNAEILKVNNELRAVRRDHTQQAEEAARLQTLNEDARAELLEVMQDKERLKVRVNQLRREILQTKAQSVRPLVFPSPLVDDDLRLLEAPTAPRTRYLTEQDIVAAFSLFDAPARGELPSWDMQLYLRCLGFPSTDPSVRKLVADLRRAKQNLPLEGFRAAVLDLQQAFAPLQDTERPNPNAAPQPDGPVARLAARLAARPANGPSENASDPGTASHASSHGASKSAAGNATVSAVGGLGSSIVDQYRVVKSTSVRREPLTVMLIEAAFRLFDFDGYGELDRKDVCTLAHALGLVGCTADVEALEAVVNKDFSGTLDLDEWTDLCQFCQGLRPTFVRRRVLEHKPPKATLYPPAFPRAGRAKQLSAKDVQTAFTLFDAESSGLIPGHHIPTYLACLGLVCSGPEFTALLITQYRADLTQRVDVEYFCRIVRFVQSNLQFFAPPVAAPALRAAGADAAGQKSREAPQFMAPPHAAAAASEPAEDRALPTRANTSAYSPRLRGEGTYPPWMVPAGLPAQVTASADEAAAAASKASQALRSGGDAGMDDDALKLKEEASLMELMQSKAENDFTTRAPKEDPNVLLRRSVLSTFSAYLAWFGVTQVQGVGQVLALPHVVLAVRSLGFLDVSRRFLESVWPYRRKAGADGAGGLVLDETEFVAVVGNLGRYGTPRTAAAEGLPKPVNRALVDLLGESALAEADVEWLFRVVDDEGKGFLQAAEFRVLLTLLGFSLRDEQDVQHAIVAYGAERQSRTSRVKQIFELEDCIAVLRKLISAPRAQVSDGAMIKACL